MLLTPYIVNDYLEVSLPSLGFYGRNRYYYYVRNGESMIDGDNETTYRDSDMPEYIPYIANVPFEEWMLGAHLMLEKKYTDAAERSLTNHAVYLTDILSMFLNMYI